MKKVRSMLLAVATTSAVLILTLLLSTASAAAVAVEFNRAVASGPPPQTTTCASTTGALACYYQASDTWYVQDTAADGASAEARWENYRNGVLYRSGICRNSLGNGNWGACNKNYYEDSTLWWRACVYNGSAGTLVRCSGWASSPA